MAQNENSTKFRAISTIYHFYNIVLQVFVINTYIVIGYQAINLRVGFMSKNHYSAVVNNIIYIIM